MSSITCRICACPEGKEVVREPRVYILWALWKDLKPQAALNRSYQGPSWAVLDIQLSSLFICCDLCHALYLLKRFSLFSLPRPSFLASISSLRSRFLRLERDCVQIGQVFFAAVSHLLTNPSLGRCSVPDPPLCPRLGCCWGVRASGRLMTAWGAASRPRPPGSEEDDRTLCCTRAGTGSTPAKSPAGFLLCYNLQPAGTREPEELRYSQAEICKENALRWLTAIEFLAAVHFKNTHVVALGSGRVSQGVS